MHTDVWYHRKIHLSRIKLYVVKRRMWDFTDGRRSKLIWWHRYILQKNLHQLLHIVASQFLSGQFLRKLLDLILNVSHCVQSGIFRWGTHRVKFALPCSFNQILLRLISYFGEDVCVKYPWAERRLFTGFPFEPATHCRICRRWSSFHGQAISGRNFAIRGHLAIVGEYPTCLRVFARPGRFPSLCGARRHFAVDLSGERMRSDYR